MFPFIMMMTYAAFITGEEWARLAALCGRALGRTGRFAGASAFLVDAAQPAQAATEIRQRGSTVPDFAVLGLGLVGLGLTFLAIEKVAWIDKASYLWCAACLVTAGIARFGRRGSKAAKMPKFPSLAYGSIGRTMALGFMGWHATAVGVRLFPSYRVFSPWRSKVQRIHSGWIGFTHTNQSWKMFAPNPPRSNTFMKTLVVEADGDVWDLGKNSYSYRPNPWIINDRMRKMQRRMVGKGKWYLKYWAEFQCREWELATGISPHSVEIWSIVSRIPSPTAVAKKGYYIPRKLKFKEKEVQTHRCNKKGRLPHFMKRRYGIDLTEEDLVAEEAAAEKVRTESAKKRRQWEERRYWFGKTGKRKAGTVARDRAQANREAVRRKRLAADAEGTDQGEDGDGAPDEKHEAPSSKRAVKEGGQRE
jgi:hypothetical protein